MAVRVVWTSMASPSSLGQPPSLRWVSVRRLRARKSVLSTPAISEGSLLYRTQHHVIAVRAAQ